MSEGVGTAPGVRIVDGRQVPEVATWEIDPATLRVCYEAGPTGYVLY